VGFDLSKSERIERASVLGTDLHNDPILIASFFDRDHLCRKRSHFSGPGRLLNRFTKVPGHFCRGAYARGTLAFFSAFPHTAQMAGIVVTRPMIVRVAPTALR
jgi:hypothetical protein